MTNKYETYLGDRHFDEKLSLSSHFQKYQDMLPWVGKKYRSEDFKLLVIGESHYFSKETDFHHDDEKWYARGDDKELQRREGHRVRYQISKIIDVTIGKSPLMYEHINKALKSTDYFKGRPDNNSIFESIAYINYFQRPANNYGKEIKPTSMDKEVAYTTILDVINTLTPNLVIFVSKKAWNAASNSGLREQTEIPMAVTSHPRTSWWNREVKGYSMKDFNGNGMPLTGQKRFIALVNHFNKSH